MTIAAELSELHQTIDQLPESAIPKLARFIRSLLADTRQKQDVLNKVMENRIDTSVSDAEFAEREDLRGWLKLSESSYSFWDNEKDAAYDAL